MKLISVTGLWLLAGITACLAQIPNDLINLFGGALQAGISRSVAAEWGQLPNRQRLCVDAGLRGRGSSLVEVIRRGIGPGHPLVTGLRSECATSLTSNQERGRSQPLSFVVDGMPLGMQLNFNSSVYKEYRCSPSGQFTDYTWCQRKKADRTAAGEVQSTNSLLHSPVGTVSYISRYIIPAFFGPDDMKAEIDRISARHGLSPRVQELSRRDLPHGVIATWGSIRLTPLDKGSLTIISLGRSPNKGILLDFLGDFSRSAQLGLPIFQISGGPGYLWSASSDQQGKGHLRFAAVDLSDVDGPVIAEADDEPNKAEPQREEINDSKRRAAESLALQREQTARAAADEALAKETLELAQVQRQEAELKLEREKREKEELERNWQAAVISMRELKYQKQISACEAGEYPRALLKEARSIGERRALRQRAKVDCRCFAALHAFNDITKSTALSASEHLSAYLESGDNAQEMTSIFTSSLKQCQSDLPNSILTDWKNDAGASEN